MTQATSVKGISALFALLFTLIGSQAAVSAGSARAAASVTFGDKPTFQSANNFVYNLSDDKEAFTIGFAGLEAELGINVAASDAPISTQVFSLVLPLTGGKHINTSFFASGYVLTEEDSNATLVFIINGQNTVVKFPPGSDRAFVQELRYRAKSASEIRLTLFLIVERDSYNADAAAFLNVLAIDADTSLAKQKAAGKKDK